MILTFNLRVFSHLQFWNFRADTNSLKSSRTYQQCQLSLLHNKICLKKPNTTVLRKEIDFSTFYITGRNKLYRLSWCSLTILGHNGNVLKQKSTIQQKNFNNFLKGNKLQHDDPEKIIFNNASYFLSEVEKSLLLEGSNFSILPKNLIMLITKSNLNYFTEMFITFRFSLEKL